MRAIVSLCERSKILGREPALGDGYSAVDLDQVGPVGGRLPLA